MLDMFVDAFASTVFNSLSVFVYQILKSDTPSLKILIQLTSKYFTRIVLRSTLHIQFALPIYLKPICCKEKHPHTKLYNIHESIQCHTVVAQHTITKELEHILVGNGWKLELVTGSPLSPLLAGIDETFHDGTVMTCRTTRTLEICRPGICQTCNFAPPSQSKASTPTEPT